MEKVSLGSLIARGRTAEIYTYGDHQVLKLFYDWCPAKSAQHETEVSRAVSRMALPTPRLVDALQVDGRQGLIYERVEGPSMLKLVNKKPWLIFRCARQFAELHSEIHKQDGSPFASVHTSLRDIIQCVKNLPGPLKTRTLEVLDKLPKGKAVCHFDFHPDQVLMTSSGPVIIDWMTVLQGHPLADVARSSLILIAGQMPHGSQASRAFIDLWRKLFYRIYISRYLELNPGVDQEQISTWMIPVAAARLKEGISGEKEWLLRFLKN